MSKVLKVDYKTVLQCDLEETEGMFARMLTVIIFKWYGHVQFSFPSLIFSYSTIILQRMCRTFVKYICFDLKEPNNNTIVCNKIIVLKQ